MAKPTGFLEFQRELPGDLAPRPTSTSVPTITLTIDRRNALPLIQNSMFSPRRAILSSIRQRMVVAVWLSPQAKPAKSWTPTKHPAALRIAEQFSLLPTCQQYLACTALRVGRFRIVYRYSLDLAEYLEWKSSPTSSAATTDIAFGNSEFIAAGTLSTGIRLFVRKLIT